jgi:hypothetical protein
MWSDAALALASGACACEAYRAHMAGGPPVVAGLLIGLTITFGLILMVRR